MADEFVEVVNTTISSTQLPSNNSTHTLKTAGANESFALKDIGIKTQSTVAEYSFLLNDFEALSFDAGESGVASGLDLIPKSGTLKIKGKNIPIDSEAVLASVDHISNATSQLLEVTEQTVIPEFCRSNETLKNLQTNFETNEKFSPVYTSFSNRGGMYSYSWRDGVRFRAIRMQALHTQNAMFDYSDTAGGSKTQITNGYSWEYIPDLNKLYYLNGAQNYVLGTNTNANISFSTAFTPFQGSFTSTLSRIYYQKGYLWLIDNIMDTNPNVIAINISSGVQIRFSGSGKNYTGASSQNYSMGFSVNYDPASDKFYFMRTNYATSNPQYINRAEVPKTRTEMNAYSSNTTVSDTFNNESNSYTRSSNASTGPFAASYPHYLRGSSVSKDIFYLADYNYSNGVNKVYYYDFSDNTLNELGVSLASFTAQHLTKALVQTREVSTADETEIGGSFSDVNVRVTGIKTT